MKLAFDPEAQARVRQNVDYLPDTGPQGGPASAMTKRDLKKAKKGINLVNTFGPVGPNIVDKFLPGKLDQAGHEIGAGPGIRYSQPKTEKMFNIPNAPQDLKDSMKSLVLSHEQAEMTTKPWVYGKLKGLGLGDMFGTHQSPEVLLKEHNALTTMGNTPAEQEAKNRMISARDLMMVQPGNRTFLQKLFRRKVSPIVSSERKFMDDTLKPYGFEFGKSPRLSPAQRKHYTQKLTEAAPDYGLAPKIGPIRAAIPKLRSGLRSALSAFGTR